MDKFADPSECFLTWESYWNVVLNCITYHGWNKREISLFAEYAEFGCGLCKKVLRSPLSTPCGHNFCKSCLVGVFLGQKDIRERTGMNGRPLRTKRIVKRCPVCEGDISDFLANPQVFL
jgi:hypothetical protein